MQRSTSLMCWRLLAELPMFLRENAEDEAIAALAEEWTRGAWEHVAAATS